MSSLQLDERDKQGAEAMIYEYAHPSMDQRVDRMRISESDRQLAKAHMHDADFMAEIIYRAAENVRSAERLMGRLFAQHTG
jgi:hypothetical protein